MGRSWLRAVCTSLVLSLSLLALVSGGPTGSGTAPVQLRLRRYGDHDDAFGPGPPHYAASLLEAAPNRTQKDAVATSRSARQ
jgi:hypothetical protein